jgi:hypothetical protein
MIGFYVAIPKTVTIDVTPELKEFGNHIMEQSKNISLNFNNACHNLTYTCQCQYPEEMQKRVNAIFSMYLDNWNQNCDETKTLTYICMHKSICQHIDTTCSDLYSLWGNSIT